MAVSRLKAAVADEEKKRWSYDLVGEELVDAETGSEIEQKIVTNRYVTAKARWEVAFQTMVNYQQQRDIMWADYRTCLINEVMAMGPPFGNGGAANLVGSNNATSVSYQRGFRTPY